MESPYHNYQIINNDEKEDIILLFKLWKVRGIELSKDKKIK